ncbi:MAG: flagellar hook-basal body complex protein [Thermoleophilaceae bacterium]
MFSAISGLKTHQIMLDVVANDIANVNTVGYKGGRTTFKDSLSQLQTGATAPGGGQAGANAAQVGLGVQLGAIDNVMNNGAFQSTGNVTDVAIQGDGWFRVGSGTPPALPASFQYTRAGNFTFNALGDLTTQDGYYVVGRTAAGGGTDTYLNVPPGSSDVAIGQDGALSYIPSGGGARVTAGFISLSGFANEAGLQRVAGNRWLESPASGAATVGTPGGNFGTTVSGTVEMSNVDLATEFTEMISAQRGFQANSRAISVSDEMLQELVNLKR